MPAEAHADPADFNSRPCVRGDAGQREVNHGISDFNSRPCVRGDGAHCRVVDVDKNFNSRPCVRGDLIRLLHPAHGLISIHAPA